MESWWDTSLHNLSYRGDFEYGYESHLERFLKEIINQPDAKDWLLNKFFENYSDVTIVTGILRSIAHFGLSDIRPYGPVMALAGLTHKDLEVRDAAIHALENWGCLEALRASRDESDKWLKEYKEKVMSDLETST